MICCCALRDTNRTGIMELLTAAGCAVVIATEIFYKGEGALCVQELLYAALYARTQIADIGRGKQNCHMTVISYRMECPLGYP